ncbi:hypothetical protein TNCV_4526991 [Trichonephila clavipes]|nr:hypothetical protein TNCV_4526991 [Trichonephila clavipes]
MTLLNSRGGSTTRPSSFLIGRPPKVFTRPSDSLAPHWREPNNGFLWSFSNAPVTKKNSSKHLNTSHHVAIHPLKPFSHRPPRRQASQSDRPPQLSNNWTQSRLLWLQTYWCYRPEAKQWTMTPKPRALSPTHKCATCSNLSN